MIVVKVAMVKWVEHFRKSSLLPKRMAAIFRHPFSFILLNSFLTFRE